MAEAEATKLTAQKDFDYQKMRDMREDIKAVENLRKTADRLAREGHNFAAQIVIILVHGGNFFM